MSYKWPDKDPDEIVDYSVDWSRFLDTDSVSSVAWYINAADGTKTLVADGNTVNGLQLVQRSNTATVATARFALGTRNVRYTITCAVTTSAGLLYERSIFLRAREK